MKKLLLITLLFMLVACVSKQDIMTSEHSKTVYVNENYQSVFKKIREQMEKCLETGIVLPLSPVSHEIDAQLYSDLGYGEISYYQKNLSKIYYHFIKVQRKGEGADITINTAGRPKSINDKDIQMYARWISGSNKCE